MDAVVSVVWPDTERVPVAVRLVAERLEVDALARDDWPDTVRVPLDERDDVATIVPDVIAPLVREEMVPVTALRTFVNKLDEVALVFVRSPITEEENVGVSESV